MNHAAPDHASSARSAPPGPGSPEWLEISDHEGRLVACTATRGEAMEKARELLGKGQPWVDVRWGETGTGRRIRIQRKPAETGHRAPRPARAEPSEEARAVANGISCLLCLVVALLVWSQIQRILHL